MAVVISSLSESDTVIFSFRPGTGKSVDDNCANDAAKLSNCSQKYCRF